MSITFYYGSGSPYAWRVWLALEHKQIPYELKLISFSAGDTKKPEFLKLNPRHRVPVIVDGEFVLYESVAIMEYLEDQYPNTPALFPTEPKKRAIVRRIVQEADLYFGMANEHLVEEVLFKPEAEWNEDKIAHARKELVKELAKFESMLTGDFLTGQLSAADFTLYPIIALTLRIEKKKSDLGIHNEIGLKFAAWMKRIEALPYFEKTVPPHWKSQ